VSSLEHAFGEHRPSLVFHAAAHKHVPMMEANPVEAVKNNIIGTENVIRACRRFDVERFILISTDKAVNPASVMGASKRIAEILTQSMNSHVCKLAAVWFGNVLGSSGSVISTFKKQIEMGGPVTVTHQNMERYFMTIPEAVSLVMIAGTLAEGGEIFELDMGKPVNIYDLAKEMIRMSGLEPDHDIKIEFVGARPGEKMFEEIAFSSEEVIETSQEKLYVMKSNGIDTDLFMEKLAAVKQAALLYDYSRLATILMETVGSFS
jgi:FlaA1/EpsC-like NDP-sugar epimerase